MAETKNIDPSIQLRALRWALGKNYKPLSSQDLAELINIPPQAVRSVESRRRKLSGDDRLNIEILSGAIWDEESNQWITIWDGTPYTREKYEFYISNEFHKRDWGPDERAHYHRMVDLYLDRLTREKFSLALTKLYRALHLIAERDNVSSDELKLEALRGKKKSH